MQKRIISGLLERFVNGVMNDMEDQIRTSMMGCGIDHINGDGYDNRIENLRLATQSQNTMNFKGCRVDSKHNARGVSWNISNKKWESSICVKGNRKYLGLFEDKQQAIKIASDARKEFFGEFWTSQNGN